MTASVPSYLGRSPPQQSAYYLSPNKRCPIDRRNQKKHNEEETRKGE
jgi:hypothetical protein